jgi:hypothetical protein
MRLAPGGVADVAVHAEGAEAKKQNKPIFLSIGYSTCHWCHVMARESFADAEIGKLLNASFIAIKVDREERPDIDSVYVAAARVFNGEAGWPLNAILTPDGKPFVAAAYLPKEKLRTLLEDDSPKSGADLLEHAVAVDEEDVLLLLRHWHDHVALCAGRIRKVRIDAGVHRVLVHAVHDVEIVVAVIVVIEEIRVPGPAGGAVAATDGLRLFVAFQRAVFGLRRPEIVRLHHAHVGHLGGIELHACAGVGQEYFSSLSMVTMLEM